MNVMAIATTIARMRENDCLLIVAYLLGGIIDGGLLDKRILANSIV